MPSACFAQNHLFSLNALFLIRIGGGKAKKRFPKGALPPVGQGGQGGQGGTDERLRRGGMVQMSTDKYEAACGGEKVFKTIPAAWEQMAAVPLSPPQMS